MATQPAALAKAGKFGDLKRRLMFLVLALVVYRVGAHIPVPGIDPNQLSQLFQGQQGGILGMFNLFSGGALSRFTVFALGIMPYISASIIMQLLTVVVPVLEAKKKEGEAGRREITKYTRWFTVGLATFQAIGIAIAIEAQPGLVLDPGPAFRFMTVVSLVTAAVVFVERGQRKITVNYAKRQVGNRVYGGQTSHLPLKLNMSGVIPPIFASSIILFPATIAQWFTSGESSNPAIGWLRDVASTLSPGQPVYTLMYALAIVFFCFFYTALVFNSRETAENLKKSGAFVPGIRPGEQTAKYIDRILMRLTLVGAGYITAVCLLPEFLVLKWNVPFYFGGTSLLIIVVVTMDFMAQVQAYVMSHQYESLLKKAGAKGAGA